MSRTGRKMWLLISVLAVLCLLGIGSSFLISGEEKESAISILRVSVILPHEDDGYWDYIQDGMEGLQPEYEQKYHMDIKYLFPQLNYNIAQMTELIRQESAAKADVLVVQGNENPDYIEALKEAEEQGTQIICMDTDISEFPAHLYIGTDNYDAGRKMGEMVVSRVTGPAKVAIISGEAEYLNLRERLQGFQDVLALSENLEITSIVYDHYDGLTALRLFHELSREAEVIVFLEGVPGTTLQSVYSGKMSEYEHIFGFDAYIGVKNGLFDGIILQDTRRIGEMVLEKLGEEAESGKRITGNCFTEAVALTQENYDEVMG